MCVISAEARQHGCVRRFFEPDTAVLRTDRDNVVMGVAPVVLAQYVNRRFTYAGGVELVSENNCKSAPRFGGGTNRRAVV